MTRNRFLILFLLIAIGGGLGYWLSQRMYQNITISVQYAKKITLYQSLDSDASQYDPAKKPVLEAGNGTYRVKKGSYVYVATADTYAPLQSAIRISNTPAHIQGALSLNSSQLSSLLTKERPAISAAIVSAYPAQMRTYTLQRGQLFEQGDWFAGELTAPSQDRYLVVLHKESGSWKVKTNPPALILNQPTYPEIPGDVIEGANEFTF